MTNENKMAELEVKKMKQGMSYTCKEKTIILNVFKYFRCQYPDKCVTDIVRRTAKATGCSEKSVFQFRKEEASVEGFKEPSKTKVRKNININSRDIKYDNTVRATIRNIIYDLKYKNIVPSLNTILKQVNADKQMPNFSLMTLRRLMFDMGFSYQKNGNKSVLVEKPDNRFMNVQNQNEMNNHMQHQTPVQVMTGGQEMVHMHQIKQPPPPPIPNAPDPRLVAAPMHKPMHIPTLPPVPPQHDPSMMVPNNEILHTHPHQMLHKSMPMMVNPRRDMMPPPPPPTLAPPMDIHRKRDPMTPWMHGIIKQGQ